MAFCWASVETSGTAGYSSFTPGSHSKTGQQSGNEAVLFVLSDSLHFGLFFGNGPQSSTNSYRWKMPSSLGVSDFTHVDRPQNGVRSQLWPASTVAQRVEAKHTPGKSVK